MNQTDIGIQNQKLWNKDYINLIVINVFTYMGFYLVTPILSVYAMDMGASLTVAGLIVGLFALTALFICPFGGVLTDRTNKKYIMIIGTFINAISIFGYSIAPNLGILIFFRMIHGASFSITGATALAWATDFIPDSRLGEGIGYLGIAQIFATAFGPELGIEASGRYGIPKTFLLAAGLLLFSAVCMLFVTNEQKGFLKKTTEKREKLHFKDIIAFEILPLSLIGGLFSMGNGLVSSFLVDLGQVRHISGVGLYFTVNAVFLLITRPLSGKIYDKKGLSVILYPGLIFSTIEALLLGHAYAIWMIIIAAIVKAFGQGIAQPALHAESFRKIGSNRRGVASSTFYIGASVGQGFGPLIGGGIASTFGYEGMFHFSAVMLICGMIGYYFYSVRAFAKKEAVSAEAIAEPYITNDCLSE